MLGHYFFEEFPLSSNPEDLEKFSALVPETTPLLPYLKRYDDNVITKSLIIQSSLKTFFLNFNKILIEIYEDNKIHFIDAPLLPNDHQFNYLWLSPTTLRECYFREGRGQSRFKSMTELGYPSLVVYPLGNVMSVPHGAWGDILLDLITHRHSIGRPTWIVKYKNFSECPEIKSSPKLEEFLRTKMTEVFLDSGDDNSNSSSNLIAKDDSNKPSTNGSNSSSYL